MRNFWISNVYFNFLHSSFFDVTFTFNFSSSNNTGLSIKNPNNFYSNNRLLSSPLFSRSREKHSADKCDAIFPNSLIFREMFDPTIFPIFPSSASHTFNIPKFSNLPASGFARRGSAVRTAKESNHTAHKHSFPVSGRWREQERDSGSWSWGGRSKWVSPETRWID